MPPTGPVPFELNVDQTVLDDLQQRLASTRWPDEIPQNGWRFGTDLAYLKSLVDYWRTEYDWRKHRIPPKQIAKAGISPQGIPLTVSEKPAQPLFSLIESLFQVARAQSHAF